jgi:hypothetical protein
MNNYQNIESANVVDLYNVAVSLRNTAIASGALTNPAQVFPQLNAEKSLFAYAANKLFPGRRDLKADEKAQAAVIANKLQLGFNVVMAELERDDVIIYQAVRSEEFKAEKYFKRSQRIIETPQGLFQLAISRKKVQGSLVTNLCFVPYDERAQASVAVGVSTPVVVTSIPAVTAQSVGMVMNGHLEASTL